MAIINEARYFISLSKCPFSPSTFITFLGFISDSVRQVFLLRSCFSHLVQLWNGYPSHYNGTFGRFAVFVDFWLYRDIVMPDIWLLLVYVLYVLCPWKAVQRCAACLYPNDRNANFCQVCGASTGTSVPSISQPDLDMTAVNNHFVELGPCPVENPIRDRSPPWSDNWLVSSPPLPPWSPYLQVHPRILLNFLLVEIGQAEQLFTHRHVIGNCVSAPADWQPVLLTPSLGSYTLFVIGQAASILQTLSRIPWWKNIWNLPGKSRQVQR